MGVAYPLCRRLHLSIDLILAEATGPGLYLDTYTARGSCSRVLHRQGSGRRSGRFVHSLDMSNADFVSGEVLAGTEMPGGGGRWNYD